MTRKKEHRKASFWFGEHRPGDDALGEAHALADMLGDVDAAPVIYLAIGACEPEIGAGFAVSSYKCSYTTHYSGYANRRWKADRAASLDRKLHRVAERAIKHADCIRAVHEILFADASLMNTEQRFLAAKRFRTEIRRILDLQRLKLTHVGK